MQGRPGAAKRASGSSSSSTLVVLWGQLRGGVLVATSVLRHVLRPLAADLALLGPNVTDTSSMLVRVARHRWSVPDAVDWGVYLGSVSRASAWRAALCNLDGAQFLGGVSDCQKQHQLHQPARGSTRRGGGSAAILLYYRYALQQRLLALASAPPPEGGLVYDWIVTSRADYLWLCDLFDGAPMASLEPAVYSPTTQTWGGYTDRIAVMHRTHAHRALNVTRLLLSSTDFQAQYVACTRNRSWMARGARTAERLGRRVLTHEYLNLEALVMAAWLWYGLPVRLFRLPAVNVALPRDPSRWSLAHHLAELAAFGLSLKGRADEANWWGALKACRTAPRSLMSAANGGINATLADLNASAPALVRRAMRLFGRT